MNIEPNSVSIEQTPAPVEAQIETKANGFMKWLPLLVMSLALTIIILDTTILNVTLRTIVVDLHTTLQKIQWVITAYSLMLAAFTITGGRLGDLFGRKKMFVTGAIIFAIGSFMTSIAQSVGFMILGEAIIEGIGACLMLPATLSLLRSNYKGRDLQVAFGIWGGIIAGAAAMGPVIGGWFTTHYTWRWAFRVNVFVAALLVLASVFINEYSDKKEGGSIDYVGILLSALGMLSTVFGFIQASVFGWWKVVSPLVIFSHVISFGSLSATPFFILLGIIILGLFFVWERHMEKAGKTPLVSLGLFTNKAFMTGSGVSAILALGQAGLSFAVPVYLQTVLQLDPLHTGLAMIPMTAVILISAPLSAWISKFITPKRIIQLGIVLDALGFIVLRQSLQVGASQWALAPGLALFGLGLGFMMAQASNLTLSAVSVAQSGEASGVNNTLRSLGQTLGSAVIGAILISAIGTNLISGIQTNTAIPQTIKPAVAQAVASQSANLEFGDTSGLSNNQLPTAVVHLIVTISNQATVDASRTALIYGLVFILLGLVVSVQLPTGEMLEEGAEPEIKKPSAIPIRNVQIGAIALILVVAGAASTTGYYMAKHKYANQVTQNTPSVATVQTPAINAPGADTTVSNVSEASVKLYNDPTMHFSVDVPNDWTVQNANSQVVIHTADNEMYSIQEYSVGSNDDALLQSFLASQSNIHTVTATTINGIPAYTFSIDGVYKQGYAFLENNNLYYLLGDNIQNSSIAQTFRAI